MRKIILLSLVLFTTTLSFSQSITNRATSAITAQDMRLMAGLNLFIPRYADTTAALSGTNEGIDSCGAVIYTYNTNTIWIRGCSPKRWIELSIAGSGVNIYNSDGMLTGDRELDGSGNNLDFSNLSIFRVTADGGQALFCGPDSTSINRDLNYISVRGDSSKTPKKISYLSNIHSTFNQYTLIDKSYADSITNVSSNVGWKLLGNAGTVDGTNFIGTTDNIPFNIRVNNQKAGKIDQITTNTSFGYISAANITTALSIAAFGHGALNANTRGNNNTALGAYTLVNNTLGYDNLAVGTGSLNPITSGNYNTGVGSNTLFSVITGNANTALGYSADVLDGLTNANAIGAQSKVTQNNSMVLGAINGINGSLGDTKVGIGTTAPDSIFHVVGGFKLVNGTQGANKLLQSDASGGASWVSNSSVIANAWNINGNLGTTAGTNFIGTTDSIALTIKVNNQQAGKIELGGSSLMNAYWGLRAGLNNSTGYQNTGVGFESLQSNTQYQNTGLGYFSLHINSTGHQNTGVGAGSILLNTTGNENTGIGTGSLPITSTGSMQTGIGRLATVSPGTLSNATAIGAYSMVTQANSLVLGSINGVNGATADTKVGIGNTTPTERLDVTGNFRLSGALMPNNLPGTAGYLLTSAGTGTSPTWTNPSSIVSASGWALLGNAGTTSGTNFIGTTDNIDVVFKRNNTRAGILNNFSTAFGVNSLTFPLLGTFNTAFGTNTLTSNNGSNNTAIGAGVLQFSTTAQSNTGVGTGALSTNTTGDDNTALGSSALASNTTGSENIAIGFASDVITGGLVNAIAVGNNSRIGQDSSASYGDTAANIKHGFGTAYPTQRMDIRGNLRISGALMPNNDAGTSGYLLQSGGVSTYPTWVNPSSLLGNYFIEGGNAFGSNAILGLTDHNNLSLITNNIARVRITKDGETTVFSPTLTLEGGDPFFNFDDNAFSGGGFKWLSSGTETMRIENEADGDRLRLTTNKYGYTFSLFDLSAATALFNINSLTIKADNPYLALRSNTSTDMGVLFQSNAGSEYTRFFTESDGDFLTDSSAKYANVPMRIDQSNGNMTILGSLTCNNITSGTYTPTLFNTTNITSSTPIICHYTRNGNEVTVTGSVGVVTTLAVASTLGISLPIASNLAATTDLSGLGQASSAIATNVYSEANTANDRANLNFVGLSIGGSGTLYFNFTYTIL